MTPKFRIGQPVYLKDDVDYYVALHNKKYDTFSNPRPRSLTIVGILIDECNGGVQIHYKFIQLFNPIPEIAIISELPQLEKIKD